MLRSTLAHSDNSFRLLLETIDAATVVRSQL